MAESLRRSGRERKKNSRYAFELLDEDELDDIPSPENDSDASSFEHIENGEEEEADDDDDLLVMSDDEAFAHGNEDGGQVEEEANDDLTPMELETNVPSTNIATKTVKKLVLKKPRFRPTSRRYVGLREDGLRSRGVLLHAHVMSKEITVRELAGCDEVLTQKMRLERSKYGGTVTLPFRQTMGDGQSGMDHPEVFDEEVRRRERLSFLNWYQDHGGWKVMREAQAISSLDAQTRDLYIHTGLPPQHILLGPYQVQHQFVLDYHDSLSVSEAWKTAIDSAADSHEYDNSASDRQAWILNLGSRILAMEWAPNQTSDYQFLAIAVDKDRPEHIRKVSALEAEEPFEATIQIWAFKTKIQDNITLMDMNRKPHLVHVICAKWGTIRRISWCPTGLSIEENSSSIGILAMISTDGYIRLIDVCVDIMTSNPYVKYKSAAFASIPPDTICTCLTWLSSERLAAGCSDGHVAIWSLDQHFQAQRSMIKQSEQASSSAIPFWYHSLHSTYINSIVAHQPYPSEYITTNGVDGRVRLTSIRHPYADSVHGSRERHLMPPLVYSPHILGFYEIDETDGLRARPLRHMPVSRSVGKAPSQVMCMDAGKVHPTLLFGCADGNAMLTNPIRRMFIRRLVDERIEAWQQTWFKHEFVPATRFETTDYATSLHNDLQRTTHVQPREGMSRFLESLKLETVSLARHIQAIRHSLAKDNQAADLDAKGEAPSSSKRKEKKKKRQKQKQYQKATEEKLQGRAENIVSSEDVQISIYEEEQAVTCLSWNPNIQTGGWAAAGMANGLVRIEDLAV